MSKREIDPKLAEALAEALADMGTKLIAAGGMHAFASATLSMVTYVAEHTYPGDLPALIATLVQAVADGAEAAECRGASAKGRAQEEMH
jgi:hypothetical protein